MQPEKDSTKALISPYPTFQQGTGYYQQTNNSQPPYNQKNQNYQSQDIPQNNGTSYPNNNQVYYPNNQIHQQNNQVYQPNVQGYDQGYNQGYPPNNNQGYPPQVQIYQQNQGFQPGPYGPYPPPPPPQNTLVQIKLPAFITTNHPQYSTITQQINSPCSICSYRGADIVTMTPGCTAYSWSICLFIFTGICCFWIPFVCDSCKDIKISCSRCGRTKFIIEKPCC